MSGNCDVLFFSDLWLIWSHVDLDSKRMVYKTLIFMNKNWKQLKNLWHSSHTIALSKGTIFVKNIDFLKKSWHQHHKLRVCWYWKLYFLKLHMWLCLHTKFQVSEISLNSFRWGVGRIYPYLCLFLLQGCVSCFLASLFFKSKREHVWN